MKLSYPLAANRIPSLCCTGGNEPLATGACDYSASYRHCIELQQLRARGYRAVHPSALQRGFQTYIREGLPDRKT